MKIQPKWIVVGVFVISFFLAMAHCARAAEFELHAGSKVVKAPTWAVSAVIVWPKVIEDKADIRCRMMLYGPSTFKGQHQDQNIQTGCQVLTGVGHWDFGLGVNNVWREDFQNAGGINAWLTIRYNISDRFAVEYDHTSNAGTKLVNQGSDFIFVVYRY